MRLMPTCWFYMLILNYLSGKVFVFVSSHYGVILGYVLRYIFWVSVCKSYLGKRTEFWWIRGEKRSSNMDERNFDMGAHLATYAMNQKFSWSSRSWHIVFSLKRRSQKKYLKKPARHEPTSKYWFPDFFMLSYL